MTGAEMKKRSDIVSWLAMIFIIGVVSSVFTSDIQFGAIFKDWVSNDIEVTLEYLNIGLAFVTFGLLFFFIISRLGRQKKDQDLKSRTAEDWERDWE